MKTPKWCPGLCVGDNLVVLCGAAVNCMIWECGEAHKVELTVVDVGWKIVERVDCLMSEQPCTYFILGIVFSLALTLLPVAYRVYHTKDQLESLNYQALEGIYTAAQLAFGHNWRYEAFWNLSDETAGYSMWIFHFNCCETYTHTRHASHLLRAAIFCPSMPQASAT